MLTVIAIVFAVVLVVATVWLLRRRDDVVTYDQTDTTASRVGQNWVRSRHGGR